MEHKFDKQQREMDTQASYILELEGLLRENHIETSQLRQLKTRNEELTEVQTVQGLRIVRRKWGRSTELCCYSPGRSCQNGTASIEQRSTRRSMISDRSTRS